MFDLAGKVALVTGGNTGIGRAIALGFAEAGASVAILGRNEDRSRLVLNELRAWGVASMAVSLDLKERNGIATVVQRAESELGPLDILVNNAGIFLPGGLLLDESPGGWDEVLETNLTVPYLLSRHAAQSMVKRQAGKIINVSSLAGAFGNDVGPAYTVSKAALTNLTKCMAVELAPYNIQVNAIAPGWTDTEMMVPMNGSAFDERFMQRTPLARHAEPAEMAGTAIYLASQASSYVTGQTIFVDGGFSASYL